MAALEVTELCGDGIGPELREAVHTVAGVLPIDVRLEPVDLSLARRRRGAVEAYDAAVGSLARTKLGLKYPTITAEESPNAVLRARLGFSAIHRPVYSLPGVASKFTGRVALEIVRVATGGTYDDPGKRVGEDVAVSLRIVERRPCAQAARFAFALAQRRGLTVTSTSKHTIQRATDGLFEAVVRDVARDFPGVAHSVELFDALLARLVLQPERFSVVLTLNEYGDFLSDLACGLVGSLGVGASASYSFLPSGEVDVALFDPAGGSAPDIAGQGVANPTAALLAFAALLEHAGHETTGRALRAALCDAIAAGKTTPDLGGRLDTRAFTALVCDALADALP